MHLSAFNIGILFRCTRYSCCVYCWTISFCNFLFTNFYIVFRAVFTKVVKNLKNATMLGKIFERMGRVFLLTLNYQYLEALFRSLSQLFLCIHMLKAVSLMRILQIVQGHLMTILKKSFKWLGEMEEAKLTLLQGAEALSYHQKHKSDVVL